MTDKDDKPVVNFAILQSVEDYTEKSGKFRTDCASFEIPGRDSGGASTLYLPYCDKQRFDFGNVLNDFRGHGAFTPPETGKRWKMMDFILFREHFHDIHCPQPCRGYSEKNVVAAFEKPGPTTPAAEKPIAGKWTRKELVIAVVVPVVICLVSGLLGWLTPEGRRLLHLDKPQPEQQSLRPSAAPTILSLHDLFAADCSKTHILSNYTLQGNTANGQEATYSIEYIVCGDFETKSLYISFFLPRSDATLLACRYLPNVYDQILSGNLKSLLPGVIHKLPGEQSETWAELKPSGRVYVYHETPLLDSELTELTEQYKQRGLSPQFRSKEYEILRNSPLYKP